MSVADRTKRKRAAAESKTKLKSPNFFVSRTRLCLRNLPHQISEKTLKDLVIAAVSPHVPCCASQWCQCIHVKHAAAAGKSCYQRQDSEGGSGMLQCSETTLFDDEAEF